MSAQRWRDGRWSWARAAAFRRSEYEVAPLDERTARPFVEQHHYAHSWCAQLDSYGVYRHGWLVGAGVFAYPVNDLVVTKPFPELAPGEQARELARFVLLDDVPYNAESFALARMFEHERARGTLGIVSFSDPVRRTTTAGEVVLPGHVGTIYQAKGALYAGRGTPRWLRLLPDGTVFPERMLQKMRKRERGWLAGIRRLERFAGPCHGDVDAWFRAALVRHTRRLHHPGNHRYLFPLHRRVRVVGAGGSYPKLMGEPDAA